MESKRCGKCGEMKSVSEFYTDRYSPDGLNYRCRACCGEYARSDAGKAAQSKFRHSEKRKAYMAEYSKTDKFREYNRLKSERQRQKNAAKCKARLVLCNAVRLGEITRGPCEVCGHEGVTHGHHESYNEPPSIRKEAARRLKHYPYAYRIDDLYGVIPNLTSSCCSAPVIIAGETTHYHVCTTCGQPCDATKPEKINREASQCES